MLFVCLVSYVRITMFHANHDWRKFRTTYDGREHWTWTWLVRETGFGKGCTWIDYYGFDWHYEGIWNTKIFKKVVFCLFKKFYFKSLLEIIIKKFISMHLFFNFIIYQTKIISKSHNKFNFTKINLISTNKNKCSTQQPTSTY